MAIGNMVIEGLVGKALHLTVITREPLLGSRLVNHLMAGEIGVPNMEMRLSKRGVRRREAGRGKGRRCTVRRGNRTSRRQRADLLPDHGSSNET